MHQLDKKKVAHLIKEGRVTKGYTQQELSDLTGISLRSVQRIENEEVLPRLYTIRVLAEKLGVADKLAEQGADAVAGLVPEEIREASGEEIRDAIGEERAVRPNKARKIILSIGMGVLLLLGGGAFITQSARFPETAFEALLFWMAITGVYMVFLLIVWRKAPGPSYHHKRSGSPLR